MDKEKKIEKKPKDSIAHVAGAIFNASPKVREHLSLAIRVLKENGNEIGTIAELCEKMGCPVPCVKKNTKHDQEVQLKYQQAQYACYHIMSRLGLLKQYESKGSTGKSFWMLDKNRWSRVKEQISFIAKEVMAMD